MMDAKRHFPFFRWIGRTLTGRRARRTYLVTVFLLSPIAASAWLRAYIMTRKIQAVLHGLAEIRLDQTTEEQLMKMVPYLTRKDWKVGGIPHRLGWTRSNLRKCIRPLDTSGQSCLGWLLV
jgi:hypothetical protein